MVRLRAVARRAAVARFDAVARLGTVARVDAVVRHVLWRGLMLWRCGGGVWVHNPTHHPSNSWLYLTKVLTHNDIIGIITIFTNSFHVTTFEL